MENTVKITIKVDDQGSAKVTTFSKTLTDQVAKASGAVQATAAAMGKLDSAVQGASGTVEKGTRTMQELAKGSNAATTAAAESAGATGKTSSAVMRLIAKLGGLVLAWQAVKSAVRSAMEYLGQIETATLGIAAAFMTGGKYIDATSGKALTAQASLQAAQADSAKLVKELQYANLQTIATLDQLIIAYQQTLPVALAKGFNVRQVKEFTVAMVQAAGAIGLPMDQLGEETRSLLTENINPRNSRIATVLGLRNEDIAEYKNNAAGLFSFLMEKLAAYKVAGIEAQNTWAGLWSNTKDLALQYLGQGLEPLFEAVKYELQGLVSQVATLDEKTKTIKWAPEFLSGVQSLRDGVSAVIAEVYRLGMLADKVGGSMTRLLSWTPLAVVPSWAEGLHKRNEDWLKRYDASNKALSDMGMRAAGWKPMTPDMDKQIREAVIQGKKIADQTWVNIGGDEDGGGTKQLLRYFRPVEQNTIYEQQKKEEEDKVAATKASLESLKKINENYFQDQENNLKFISDITKSSSAANYLAEKDALEKRSALATEYYARTKAEISLEAQARSQEERSKLADAQFIAEKIKALDAEVAAKKRELGRQQILSTLQTAEADKQALTARLQEYQKFYDSLQGMIQKNAEDQKQKLAELSSLYRQQADLQRSTAAMLRGLDEINMTPTQKYESQKRGLSDQYMAAIQETGQGQIKALEEYKQALASFGQAWSQGVVEVTQSSFWGEQKKVVTTGQEIIASVRSNIEMAGNLQKRALEELEAEKQKEIDTSKTWGETLVQAAKEWAGEIDKLKGTIGELSDKIAQMQKAITITGEDRVSPVVDTIARALAALHEKAKAPIVITTIQRTTTESVGAPLALSDFNAGGGGESSGYMAPFDYITGYAQGTPYVPRTGLYRLHEGEIVVPPEESRAIRKRAVLQGLSGGGAQNDFEASGDDTAFTTRDGADNYALRESLIYRPPVDRAPRQTAAAGKTVNSRSVKIGDIHIHIPASAAPQRPEDWRSITREYIVPELEKIGRA